MPWRCLRPAATRAATRNPIASLQMEKLARTPHHGLAGPHDVAEIVSVDSTVRYLPQPHSSRTCSSVFFRNNDVPRPLPHTV